LILKIEPSTVSTEHHLLGKQLSRGGAPQEDPPAAVGTDRHTSVLRLHTVNKCPMRRAARPCAAAPLVLLLLAWQASCKLRNSCSLRGGRDTSQPRREYCAAALQPPENSPKISAQKL